MEACFRSRGDGLESFGVTGMFHLHNQEVEEV